MRYDVLEAKRLPDRAGPVMRPPAPTANNLGGIVDYSLPRVRSISQLHNSIIPPKLSQRNTLLLHHPPAFIRLMSLSLEIGLEQESSSGESESPFLQLLLFALANESVKFIKYECKSNNVNKA